MSTIKNFAGSRASIDTKSGKAIIYRLDALEKQGFGNISRLPFSIKVLLESVLREYDDYVVREEDIKRLASYDPSKPASAEIPFKPARVVLQDFTGVPSVVDLAALRSAMARAGGDPQKINPVVPVDLVIDHSVQVDAFGQEFAFMFNRDKEFERNRERYEFLRWGQKAFKNFSVVPPARGIVHQVNLEHLAKTVWSRTENGETILYPDSLVGTDSHTTMINGLGILGWGVGGIEAEAVMLGQPIYMLIPEVVGFKITGKMPEGATATDLTLTVTQMLRKKGVVGKFVEFYGDGLSSMSLPDRATIANMAPEYGATVGFFPVDKESLRYMLRTGRSEELCDTVERYSKEQGLFRVDGMEDPVFTDTLHLDLSTIETSLAGPKRPQDRVPLDHMKTSFNESLISKEPTSGFALDQKALANKGTFKNGTTLEMKHGDVVIAAITSCTNTSNPSVMLGAGILAKKANERGLKVPPYVKTSLAPGSRVVTEYLDEAKLTPELDKLGFNLVGYGCTTCIGNSGPLPEAVEKAIIEGELIVAGVLSGNRNFEGRIHANVKANYLASPPLVVAYALAGTVDIDLSKEPIGKDKDGKEVFLKEIWPTSDEIMEHLDNAVRPDLFHKMYDGIADSNEEWNNIPITGGALFDWKEDSTYIQEPPFFVDLTPEPQPVQSIESARVLVKVGDSITTDHISPAGSIKADSPAGFYLVTNGVEKNEFNSYGSRRGNDRVMTRGTFANVRLKNQLAPGTEGGYTTYFPTGEVRFIYDASMDYQKNDVPLIVLAGKEYGTGSSRDWAAKGTNLLGVKAVIAETFERIHRSNLVGMGVLPLQFTDGQNADVLGLDGDEYFTIMLDENIKPGQEIWVTAVKGKDNKPDFDGPVSKFKTLCRIDTPVEVDYFKNGGILQTVLRKFMKEDQA
ncbi:MAG: aconitate hydratase AcnA [Balneolales bacterium]|nr:aconitate hydratase AcnA [Balneolales bacterium]